MNLAWAAQAALIGTGATAIMDAAMAARKTLWGAAAPDYRLVGRWAAHMARGRFRHAAIAKTAPVRGELALGWLIHYATGIAFAALLLALYGRDWARHPTPLPAFVIGIGSVAAPFLVMQPAMGLGLAARKAPRPAQARLRSLGNHAIFALGLYLAGLAARLAPL